MDPQRQQYVKTLVNGLEQLIQQGDIESCDKILYKALDGEWNKALLSVNMMLDQIKENLHKKTSDPAQRDLVCDTIDILKEATEFLKQPDV